MVTPMPVKPAAATVISPWSPTSISRKTKRTLPVSIQRALKAG